MYWHASQADRIKRYFEGTYITLPEVSNEVLFVERVRADYVTMVNARGDVFQVDLGKGYNVNFRLPTNTFVYQNGQRAALLRRTGARQYRRGWCSDNTTLKHVNGEGTWAGVQFNFDTVNSIVNKLPYTSLMGAKVAFDKNQAVSAALNHRTIVTSKGRLFLFDKLIGYVNYRLSKIFVLKAFLPIVEDLLETTGEKFNVVVR